MRMQVYKGKHKRNVSWALLIKRLHTTDSFIVLNILFGIYHCNLFQVDCSCFMIDLVFLSWNSVREKLETNWSHYKCYPFLWYRVTCQEIKMGLASSSTWSLAFFAWHWAQYITQHPCLGTATHMQWMLKCFMSTMIPDSYSALTYSTGEKCLFIRTIWCAYLFGNSLPRVLEQSLWENIAFSWVKEQEIELSLQCYRYFTQRMKQ